MSIRRMFPAQTSSRPCFSRRRPHSSSIARGLGLSFAGPFPASARGHHRCARRALVTSRASCPRGRPPPQCVNNLKQIGLAMHNYASASDAFPKPAITGEQGKAILRLRVAVLPYIQQQGLYEKFKLDEPWDSPHNKAHLEGDAVDLPVARVERSRNRSRRLSGFSWAKVHFLKELRRHGSPTSPTARPIR